uniref:JmjC domain-containing protein n=1 Tax=Panagrolaimus sp. JU765 TaxID=591449 RepID=A0AC34RLQ6_9BILA
MYATAKSTDLSFSREQFDRPFASQTFVTASITQDAVEKRNLPFWFNLNSLTGIVTDLKNNCDIPGVTTSELICGLHGSASPFQTGWLEMAQYWICINSEDIFKIESRVSEAIKTQLRDCKTPLLHGDISIDIDLIKNIDDCGIPYTKTVQNPGELLVVLPGSFVQSVDTGPSVAERCHFIMNGTIELARRRRTCLCASRQMIYDVNMHPGWKPFLSLMKTGVMSMVNTKRKKLIQDDPRILECIAPASKKQRNVSHIDFSQISQLSPEIFASSTPKKKTNGNEHQSQLQLQPSIVENENVLELSKSQSEDLRLKSIFEIPDSGVQRRAALYQLLPTFEQSQFVQEISNAQVHTDQSQSLIKGTVNLGSGATSQLEQPGGNADMESGRLLQEIANVIHNKRIAPGNHLEPANQNAAIDPDFLNNELFVGEELQTVDELAREVEILLEQRQKRAQQKPGRAKAQGKYMAKKKAEADQQNKPTTKRRSIKSHANAVEYVAYWFEIRLRALNRQKIEKLKWLEASKLHMNEGAIVTDAEAHKKAEEEHFNMERHQEVFKALVAWFGKEKIDDRLKEGYKWLPIARDFINNRKRHEMIKFEYYLRLKNANIEFWQKLISDEEAWNAFFDVSPNFRVF